MIQPTEMLAEGMRDLSTEARQEFENQFAQFCRYSEIVPYENFDRYDWMKWTFWYALKNGRAG